MRRASETMTKQQVKAIKQVIAKADGIALWSSTDFERIFFSGKHRTVKKKRGEAIMKTLWALVLSLCLTTTANAALVTFNFTGSINNTPMTGSYTYETTTRQDGGYFNGFVLRHPMAGNGMPTLEGGRANAYAGAITNATMQIGDSAVTLLHDPFNNTNWPSDPWDLKFQLYKNGIALSDVPPGPEEWYVNPSEFYLVTIPIQGYAGYDVAKIAMSGDNLNNGLALPPGLNGAPAPYARFDLFSTATGKTVQWSMQFLTAVPLPGAVWLMGAGLLALVGLSARNWRTQN